MQNEGQSVATPTGNDTESDIAQGTMLDAMHVEKRFGGVYALRGVNLKIHAREIHAILGENGAGKSTLVKIVAGVMRPDAGLLFIDGQRLTAKTPQDAKDAGIAIVHQELSLFPQLTVAQNVLFGRLPMRLGIISNRKADALAAEKLAELGMEHIDPRRQVSELSLDEQQMLEIAKATWTRPKVLILDEATSSLGHAETLRLFQLVRSLKELGTTVIVITHRMKEVWELADSLTILRDGETVGQYVIGDVDQEQVVRLMAGRDVKAIFPPKRKTQSERVALEVRNVRLRPRKASWDLEVRHGEVLGIGGLEGQGQREFLLWLYGKAPGSGTIKLGGKPVKIKRPAVALAHNVVLIPEDRKLEGLHLDLPVQWNLAMATLGVRSRLGIIGLAKERDFATKLIRELDIRVDSPMQLAMSLSGGNQQKVVLGKFLARQPEVLLFVDPTRGVDVRTKFAFYEMLRKLAADGAACVLYSSETEELVGLCDRIAVFHDSAPVRILDGREISQDAIVGAAFAVEEDGRERA